jgi:hypothetical protein
MSPPLLADRLQQAKNMLSDKLQFQCLLTHGVNRVPATDFNKPLI